MKAASRHITLLHGGSTVLPDGTQALCCNSWPCTGPVPTLLAPGMLRCCWAPTWLPKQRLPAAGPRLWRRREHRLALLVRLEVVCPLREHLEEGGGGGASRLRPQPLPGFQLDAASPVHLPPQAPDMQPKESMLRVGPAAAPP